MASKINLFFASIKHFIKRKIFVRNIRKLLELYSEQGCREPVKQKRMCEFMSWLKQVKSVTVTENRFYWGRGLYEYKPEIVISFGKYEIHDVGTGFYWVYFKGGKQKFLRLNSSIFLNEVIKRVLEIDPKAFEKASKKCKYFYS